MTEITIPVRLINEGDELVGNGVTYWTAMANAQKVGASVHLIVRFADGGSGERVWDDPNVEITVQRA
jgi:hypothetical protein